MGFAIFFSVSIFFITFEYGSRKDLIAPETYVPNQYKHYRNRKMTEVLFQKWQIFSMHNSIVLLLSNMHPNIAPQSFFVIVQRYYLLLHGFIFLFIIYICNARNNDIVSVAAFSYVLQYGAIFTNYSIQSQLATQIQQIMKRRTRDCRYLCEQQWLLEKQTNHYILSCKMYNSDIFRPKILIMSELNYFLL